ncbi:MAG: hypothetical protein ABL986_15770 [Vicinamibacterales bacterium]
MARSTLGRFSRAARGWNPFAVSRAIDRVDDLRQATRELTRSIDVLRTRTDQLAAIEQSDWELQDALDALPSTLDTERVRAHVTKAIDQARLELDPFPHLLVESWLPTDVYKLMVNGLPPAIFFAEREVSRQRLSVPFRLAPRYSRRVWQMVTREIVSSIAGPLLNEKFKEPVRDYVHALCPDLPAHVDLNMRTSNGHIMLRRPGYVIAPHRDPKWGFLSCLVYLVRPGDNESYGTQLYRVKNDVEAPSFTPYYVEDSRCELVKAVPFRANTMLVFLNSVGAHGASIPADAQPASLERYLYQFRLGLENEAKDTFLAHMTDEGRARWKSEDGDKGY